MAIINMGNMCSKGVSKLSSSKSISTSNSFSSIESVYSFELSYAPHTGEGESVKVLFAFMQIPYKEVIQSHPVTQLTHGPTVVTGTLSCLRYLSKLFGLYPSDVNTTEDFCAKVVELWHSTKDDFYQNNRRKMHQWL